MVFFGYTHCTDACPWTLGVVAEAVSRFEHSPRFAPIRPIFIDFDADPSLLGPLSGLMDAVHPTMLGLAGTRRQLWVAGANWKLRRMRRGARPGEIGAQYHHTTRLYLVDPSGEVVMLIDGDAAADQIAGAMAIAQARAAGLEPR